MNVRQILKVPVVGITMALGLAGCTTQFRVTTEPSWVRKADTNSNRLIEDTEADAIVSDHFDSNQDGYLDNHEIAGAVEELASTDIQFPETREVIAKALARKLDDQHKNSPESSK